jgi:hypothetical protein
MTPNRFVRARLRGPAPRPGAADPSARPPDVSPPQDSLSRIEHASFPDAMYARVAACHSRVTIR